jgi:hypothetical protein
MKRTILLALTMVFTIGLFAQKVKVPALKFQKPSGWHNSSNLDVVANLERYEMEEERLHQLIRTNNGSVLTHLYTKYNPKGYPGVIPTIQVILRPNTTPDFKTFKSLLQMSVVQMGALLPNFELIQELTEIEIDGRKAVYFLASFEMELPNGSVQKVRSWTYGIPVGDYFYQINFSDLGPKDDCEQLYKELLAGLKVK